jgi:hypothetical protein
MRFEVEGIDKEEYDLLRMAFESGQPVEVMVTGLDIYFPNSFARYFGSDKYELVNAVGEFRLVPSVDSTVDDQEPPPIGADW